MLRCRDIPDLATDYLEGSQPWFRRAGMMFHLAYCSACRAYMDQLAKTRRLLANGRLPAPDPETERRLVMAAKLPD